jgi:beta-glucosidase
MRPTEQILSELSLDEKVALCRGSDAWHTNAVDRLGIPRLKVSDGPNGARGASFSGSPSACFPCGTALAATWDPVLVREIGEAIGLQARSKNAGVLLGPTMNIHRSPLAGRNFECYSEDPHLSARMAVAYIQGVRSVGVAACAKHLVANDSEFERHTMSSVVDERTLREISLVPFEAAIKEARSDWVMAAYNKLNGTYCAEHPWLLGELLREEWGFRGVVVSDWWGAQSTVGSANAGLDLEMPGPGVHYQGLAEAVRNGEVDEAVVDAKVRRILDTIRGTQDIDPSLAEQSLDRPEDRALIRRAGAESIVLLRNDGSLREELGLPRSRAHVLFGTPPRWTRANPQRLPRRLGQTKYVQTKRLNGCREPARKFLPAIRNIESCGEPWRCLILVAVCCRQLPPRDAGESGYVSNRID